MQNAGAKKDEEGRLRRVGMLCALAVTLFLLEVIFQNAFVKAAPSAESSQPRTCIDAACVDADPLGWSASSVTTSLTFLGNTLVDDANHLRINFPPASVLFPSTVHYTATTGGAFHIGQLLFPNRGEVLGLFQIEAITASPWETTENAGTNALLPHSLPEHTSPDQPQFLMNWSLRLEYAGCAIPDGCEFARYDEASLRCYWLNPTNGAWTATGRRIDVDENRLTCTSNMTGLYAIAGRRAETSSETEAPPVFLPIVRFE